MHDGLKQEIGKAVERETKKYPASQAIGNLRKAYSGNFWIVGGYISNIAIPMIHGYSLDEPTDVDMLLEEPFDCSLIPDMKGWERTKTFHGGLRFLKGKDCIDIWSLDACHGLKQRGIELSIENYLEIVPLTSQALAYDYSKGKLYSDIGLNALLERTVEVNDWKEVLKASWRPWHEYLKRKAAKLKFVPKF